MRAASPLGEAPARRRVMRERLPGQSVYGIQRQGHSSSGPSGHLPPRGKAKSPPILAHFPALCPANTNTKPRRGYLRGFVHRGVGKYIKVSECLD